MKRLLLLASFAFVLSVALGQGYGRRGGKRTIVTNTRTVVHEPAMMKPVVKKPVVSKAMRPMMDPMMDSMMMDPMMNPRMAMGGHMGGIKDPVVKEDGTIIPLSQLLGGTITGLPIVGGQDPGFRLHGGAGAGPQFANGLVNGWGGMPEALQPEQVSGWAHPFNNRPFDPAYEGGRLVFDERRGMMVAEQIMHNNAKATGAMLSDDVEHGIVKEANHVARKTIAGGPIGAMGLSPRGLPMKPATIEHQIAKSSGGLGVIGHRPMGKHSIGLSPIEHTVAKSSTMHGIGGPVVQHEAIKSTRVGPAIHHGIAKSSNIGLGVGPIGGGMHHDIAKSSGIGLGFDDDVVGHNIAKSSATAFNPFGESVGMIGGPGSIQHGIAKSSGIGPMPIGHGMPPKKSRDPVHKVEKVIRSGATSHGHDDLSVGLGNQIAREIARQSAHIIDQGTGGGVSMGDPIAQQAAKGLASETAHVVEETLGLASRKKSSPMLGGSHLLGTGRLVGGGMGLDGLGGLGRHHGIGGMMGDPLLGGKPMIHQAPKIPKVPIANKGYGRRTRRPRRRRIVMRNW